MPWHRQGCTVDEVSAALKMPLRSGESAWLHLCWCTDNTNLLTFLLIVIFKRHTKKDRKRIDNAENNTFLWYNNTLLLLNYSKTSYIYILWCSILLCVKCVLLQLFCVIVYLFIYFYHEYYLMLWLYTV